MKSVSTYRVHIPPKFAINYANRLKTSSSYLIHNSSFIETSSAFNSDFNISPQIYFFLSTPTITNLLKSLLGYWNRLSYIEKGEKWSVRLFYLERVIINILENIFRTILSETRFV